MIFKLKNKKAHSYKQALSVKPEKMYFNITRHPYYITYYNLIQYLLIFRSLVETTRVELAFPGFQSDFLPLKYVPTSSYIYRITQLLNSSEQMNYKQV